MLVDVRLFLRLCRKALFETKGTPAGPVEAPDRWFLSHRVTPLIPINDAGARAKGLPPLQSEFLKDAAAWKASNSHHGPAAGT